MITLQNATLQRGTKRLLEYASLTIFAKQKVGIVGINGCGKSSLFALILNQLQLDAGELSVQRNIRIAYLSQEVPHSEISALDYVIQGDRELAELTAQLANATQTNDGEAASLLHNRMYELDGYGATAKAAKLLNGLGFAKHEHHKCVNAFSGGWRMRLNLAQVLMCPSDLMLLDEPTNYLDMDAIVWLEDWLQNYTGTLLLISHDREFLDNVVQKIAHMHDQTIDLYSGNYTSFEEQRAEKISLEKKAYVKQQAKIEHLTSYINRFKAKASKARQAQSRMKTLAKMERVTLSHFDSPFSFTFYKPEHCAAPVLRLEKVEFAYQDHKVLSNVNLSLNPEDRIGILGVNGAGKSTLMKLLAGILQPSSGTTSANKSLKIGYFAQHQVDQLNLAESAFAHIANLDKTSSEQQIRSFLGGFAFAGDMVFSPTASFSGGEKARLVLAMLVWQKPNLLLLDEPTNHLDLDMREALAYALQDYAGTLVLVSHDRYLLKATADELYLVHDHAVEKFAGDLGDYQKWLFDSKKQQAEEQNKIAQANAPKNSAPSRENIPQKSSGKLTKQLESKLEKLYAQQEELEHKLADANIYLDENKNLLAECLQKSAKITDEIKSTEEKWLELLDS